MATKCGGCSCLGIAATSLVPARRFETYVANLFPKKKDKEPAADGPFDAVVASKVKKLAEYAEKNAHRVNVIAHDLAHRVSAHLFAKQLGHARTAVAAFDALANACRDSLGAFANVALHALRLCVENENAVLAAEAAAAAAHYFDGLKANQLRSHVEEWNGLLVELASWQRSQNLAVEVATAAAKVKTTRKPSLTSKRIHDILLNAARSSWISIFRKKKFHRDARRKVERELAEVGHLSIIQNVGESNWYLPLLNATNVLESTWVVRANALRALKAHVAYRARAGALDAVYTAAAARAAARCLMDVANAPHLELEMSSDAKGIALAAFVQKAHKRTNTQNFDVEGKEDALESAWDVLHLLADAAHDASTARVVASSAVTSFGEHGAFDNDSMAAHTVAMTACRGLRDSFEQAGQEHQLQLALLSLAARPGISGRGRSRILQLARSVVAANLSPTAAAVALGLALRDLPAQLVASSLGWGAVKDAMRGGSRKGGRKASSVRRKLEGNESAGMNETATSRNEQEQSVQASHVRIDLNGDEESARMNEAAIKVQALYRGHVERRKKSSSPTKQSKGELLSLRDELETTIAVLAARCGATKCVEACVAALRSACLDAAAGAHETHVPLAADLIATAMKSVNTVDSDEAENGVPESVMLSCVELGLHHKSVCRTATLNFIRVLANGVLQLSEAQRLQLLSVIFYEAGNRDADVASAELAAASLLATGGQAVVESAKQLAATLVARGCDPNLLGLYNVAPSSLCVGVGIMRAIGDREGAEESVRLVVDDLISAAKLDSIGEGQWSAIVLAPGKGEKACVSARRWCIDRGYGEGKKARAALLDMLNVGDEGQRGRRTFTGFIGDLVASPNKLARAALAAPEDATEYVPLSVVADVLEAKHLKYVVHKAVVGTDASSEETDSFTTSVFKAMLNGGVGGSSSPDLVSALPAKPAVSLDVFLASSMLSLK